MASTGSTCREANRPCLPYLTFPREKVGCPRGSYQGSVRLFPGRSCHHSVPYRPLHPFPSVVDLPSRILPPPFSLHFGWSYSSKCEAVPASFLSPFCSIPSSTSIVPMLLSPTSLVRRPVLPALFPTLGSRFEQLCPSPVLSPLYWIFHQGFYHPPSHCISDRLTPSAVLLSMSGPVVVRIY